MDDKRKKKVDNEERKKKRRKKRISIKSSLWRRGRYLCPNVKKERGTKVLYYFMSSHYTYLQCSENHHPTECDIFIMT
jgi:predicted  nucleic acid-binding Zn ribbon protein